MTNGSSDNGGGTRLHAPSRRRRVVLAVSAAGIGLSSFAVTASVIAPAMSAHAAAVATDTCGYPNGTSPPKSSTAFNENTLTQHVQVYGSGVSAKIGVFSNDEKGILLGVNGADAFWPVSSSTLNTALGAGAHTTIQLASIPTSLASGNKLIIETSPTKIVTVSGNYLVSAVPVTVTVSSFTLVAAAGTHVVFDATNPNFAPANHESSPVLGDTSAAAQDASGRPVYPALFLTDLTLHPGGTQGDWQQGGSATTAIDDVFGSWDTATLAAGVFTTTTPVVKNNWNLGPGADSPTGGFGTNEGYGTEFRWDVSNLGLTPGHTYRVQVMSHDGDQNKGGGDVGELCTSVLIPPSAVTTTVQDANNTAITTAAAGTTVHDHAVVSGNAGTPTGSVSFAFYTNDKCTAPAASTESPVNLNSGAANSSDQTGLTPGSYSYKVTYSGDNTYPGAVGDCEPFTITNLTPKVDTDVKDAAGATLTNTSVASGTTVHDVATVSGSGATPDGTVDFKFFDNNNCRGAAVDSDLAVAMAGGVATSKDETPATGAHAFLAHYNPGAGSPYDAADGTCETFAVNQALTDTSTSPSSSTIVAGDSVHDTATLSGGNAPTGTYDFALYAATDVNCATPLATVSNIPVNGNNSYDSTPDTQINTAGVYYWQATYSGDNNNAGSHDACLDPAEKVIVQAQTGVTTTPTQNSITQNDSVQDQATLSGGNSPTGTMSFALYAAADTLCANPIAGSTSSQSVNGNAVYTSTPATVISTPGDYFWRATYSGDTNNTSSKDACGDRAEAVHVVAQTSVTTTPSASSITTGSSVSDTANLSGAVSPTGNGSISWALYADSDNSCSSPLFGTPGSAGTATVTAATVYHSASVVIGTPGTYYWQATFSGDANNLQSFDPCQDPSEKVVVSNVIIPPPPPPATPVISTNATLAAQVNSAITDVATLGSGNNPTGTITFNLFGPNDNSCSNPAVFTVSVPVNGNGSYSAGAGFTPTTDGTYNWTAAYSGDRNNDPATEGCGGQNETSTVSALPPPAGLHIVKTGPAVAHVGDVLTYTLVVTSTSSTPVTDVVVTDPLCDSAPTLVSQTPAASATLGPGDIWTYTCDHTVTAADPDPFVNTALAVGSNAPQVSDDFSTDIIHPAITLTKTANPVSATVGDTVTYTYVVKNSGDVTLTNVSVDDDKLGHIADIATLAPGQTLTFTKSIVVTASGPVTNIGLAAGSDPLGKVVKATDNASITVVLGEKVTRPAKKPVAKPPTLPFTGFNTTSIALDGAVLILVGAMLTLVRRRRRS